LGKISFEESQDKYFSRASNIQAEDSILGDEYKLKGFCFDYFCRDQ